MTAYLFDNRAYPIVTSARDIVPALRDPFCRAVTLRDPALAFDAAGISATTDPALAQKYRQNESKIAPMKAGRCSIEGRLTESDITWQAEEAKITMNEESLENYVATANAYREIFTDVFSRYNGMYKASVRSFALFTPIGGEGRSPHLHVDNAILTLHWSAALSQISIANGEPSEQTWNALDVKRTDIMGAQRDEYLKTVLNNPEHDMRDNAAGDAVILKGQRNRNLSYPFVRRTVCVHASSPSIIENGQAALLLVPNLL